MISCELMGGLGNELFQIASAYSLSLKHKVDFYIPEWKNSKYFNIPNFKKSMPEIFQHNQKQFHYYNRPYQCGTLYKGYYQSSKFFEGFDSEIKSLFELKNEYKYEELNNSCSIHVRRGDYLQLEQFHPVQTMKYFDEAIHRIKKEVRKVNFIVFSDDIKWCKENFHYSNLSFSEGEMIEDFAKMISCTHHIISNSSFSWWTAYLSQKGLVIAPVKWFGPALSHDTRDIYEKDWIQV